MPNWVSNYISIVGSEEEVEPFVELISERPRLWPKDSNWTPMKDFSFHSFISGDSVDPDVYHEVNGSGPNGSTGDGPDNWYQWNTRNWDTKWDACSVSLEKMTLNGQEHIILSFETAWSYPAPVFGVMCEKFPNLRMLFEWEEEQGYGAKGENIAGEYVEMESWDIPNSHADYQRSGAGECVCEYTEDKRDWFDDCPGKNDQAKMWEVIVTSIYKVLAECEDDAITAVQSHESGFDLPNNTEVRAVLYNNKYQAIETEEENTNE
jgi:hypothetical protein